MRRGFGRIRGFDRIMCLGRRRGIGQEKGLAKGIWLVREKGAEKKGLGSGRGFDSKESWSRKWALVGEWAELVFCVYMFVGVGGPGGLEECCIWTVSTPQTHLSS